MKIVLSPHNDDETLFAAFTILREKPHVIVCYGSAGDYGRSEERKWESDAAVRILGGGFEQWNVKPGDADWLHSSLVTVSTRYNPERVYAPDLACSHPDHRLLATVARDVFKGRLTTYHTYDSRGRVINQSRPVPISAGMVDSKLQALACYKTQIYHPRAEQFFLDDQREYYGEDV